jgi:hypothetical protein
VPQIFETRVERRVANKLSGPELLKELGLRDNPVMMPYQIGQQLKHLEPERHGLASTTELLDLGIERIFRKNVAHTTLSLPA